MSFNKKQIIIASITAVLIYFCFLMSKDIIRDYDKERLDNLRKEYVDKRLKSYRFHRERKWKEYEFMAEAELRYPYGTDTPATRILFFKFAGEYYRHKFTFMFLLFTIGGMLVYSLRDKEE